VKSVTIIVATRIILVLRSGVFAASRRMEACSPPWFETAQERLRIMRLFEGIQD
jgi:hypothetical protein